MQTSDNIFYAIWNTKNNQFFNGVDSEDQSIWHPSQFIGFETIDLAYEAFMFALSPLERVQSEVTGMQRKENPPNIRLVVSFYFANDVYKMYVKKDATLTENIKLAHLFHPEEELIATRMIEYFLTNKLDILKSVPSTCRNVTIDAEVVE